MPFYHTCWLADGSRFLPGLWTLATLYLRTIFGTASWVALDSIGWANSQKPRSYFCDVDPCEERRCPKWSQLLLGEMCRTTCRWPPTEGAVMCTNLKHTNDYSAHLVFRWQKLESSLFWGLPFRTRILYHFIVSLCRKDLQHKLSQNRP